MVLEIYDRLLGLEAHDWNLHYKKLFAEIMEFLASYTRAQEEPKPKTSPSLPLADYAGIYEHPAFDRVEVLVDDDTLKAKFQSGLNSELEHFNLDVFEGTTSDFYLPAIKVRFHLSNGGTVESFSMPLESGVAEIVFKRIEEENKEK